MNKKKIIIIIIAILIVLTILLVAIFSFNAKPALNENPPINTSNNPEDIYKNFPSKPKSSSKKYTKTESSAIQNEPTIIEEKKNNTVSKEIKNKVSTKDKKVELNNIKLSYDGVKLYLSFTITNKSNSTYDLSKYNLYLYDKNKRILGIVDGTALGKLSSKESISSSIEFDYNISSVTNLELKEK